jgi:hypothetical protein
MRVRLSKSKLIAFRQCAKRLWLEVHRPELKVEDASAMARFASGHKIGELAQAQYPGGVLIAPDNNLTSALAQTQTLLHQNPPNVLFEATFQAEGLLVRADLLIPDERGWQMIEVKSATQVKDYHLDDAAIQSWVASQAGLVLTGTSLQVVDSSWTYPGESDYAGLLKTTPVDAAIAPLLGEVPKWLAAAQATVSATEPTIKVGKQCNTPFACSFQSYCGALTPPVEFPIAWLPNLHHTKRSRYEEAGVVDLRDVKPEELSDKQRRVLQATLNNQTYFEPLSASEAVVFAGTRHYLDFETMAFVVPIWAGTRPYQQVPFQWSCHVEAPDGAVTHEMFLDLSGNDPSRAFAESLIQVLKDDGPIIVYNQGFEKRIIRELAQRFAGLEIPLTRLLSRVVDLLPLAGSHYYNPSMQGSWSIKAVLPAIAPELDYSNLEEVAGGTAAQDAFAEAIGTATTPQRKVELENALRKYCTRDTEAMIVVLHYLMHGSSTDEGLTGA